MLSSKGLGALLATRKRNMGAQNMLLDLTRSAKLGFAAIQVLHWTPLVEGAAPELLWSSLPGPFLSVVIAIGLILRA